MDVRVIDRGKTQEIYIDGELHYIGTPLNEESQFAMVDKVLKLRRQQMHQLYEGQRNVES